MIGIRALRLALSVALIVGAAQPAAAQSLQAVPALESRVTDLTGTLTAEQQSTLEEKLKAFEARKGSQLAVLIVATTQPEEIEQFSIRVVEKWQLGRKKVDDGALLIVAKNDRALRIEVGRGLEGVLTDVSCHRIIAETITPLFRQGDFFGGINAGLDQMIRLVDGEQLPPPDERWQQSRGSGGSGFLPVLIFGVFAGSLVLRGLLGRGIGSVATGALTGGLLWLIGQALLFSLFGAVVAFAFSLFAGASVGRGWSNYPRSGGLGGGWGGGFGGGLGGGGGFGGGGGGFGGGGSSGRW